MAGQISPVAGAEETRQGIGVNYSREWKAYARRRNLALVLLFGAAPFGVAACLVSNLWLNQIAIGIVLLVAWCGAACAAIWWAGEFRCPRCYRRFAALGSRKGLGTIWRGLFDKVCENCKLRRWEMS